MSTLTKSTIAHAGESQKLKVLILGGGFGGIKAALELSSSSSYDVQLISDQPNFRYYPTLYKTATGKSQDAAAIPLVEIFDGKAVTIIQDKALSLDRVKKNLQTASGKTYEYDLLIVALGVETNFFGISGLDKYSYGVKTLEEAHRLRDHLHSQILDDNKPDLNYVVVGGGATGVELVGVLPTYIKYIMKKHKVAKANLNIELIESAPRLMPRMSEKYSKKLAKRLRKLGIKLYLGQTVQSETAEALIVNGRPINSHTVVWTAGMTNNPFLKNNRFNLNEHGKAIVDEHLQTEPDIYVIGDNADTPYSGMAQTALHDAVFVAENLKRKAHGKSLGSYTPKKPIYVTPAGPYWAAVSWGKIQLFGIFGWVLREFADLIAYHDLEPWWKASKHWIAETKPEEICPVCKANN